MLLCSRGEPMSEEEVNKMLVFASDENGRVYYVGARLHACTALPLLCCYRSLGAIPRRGPQGGARCTLTSLERLALASQVCAPPTTEALVSPHMPFVACAGGLCTEAVHGWAAHLSADLDDSYCAGCVGHPPLYFLTSFFPGLGCSCGVCCFHAHVGAARAAICVTQV